jgi:hypothetical protein
MQNGNECYSEKMGAKLQQLNSLLCMVRRTMDSPDASIYTQEVINLMLAASEITAEIEGLRKAMDVAIYQKNSKFYGLYSQAEN